MKLEQSLPKRCLLLLLWTLSSCTNAPAATLQAPAASSTPTEDLRLGARVYLEEAFQAIEEQAYYAESVDWSALRAEVFERTAQVTDINELHIQIQYALGKLRDDHSHMMTPEMAQEYWTGESFMDFPEPWGELVDGRYGYIWMGGFASGSQEVTDDYASRLQQEVIDLDRQAPCAWVVDLRENNGGDIYAMVAGLGEVIGDGLVMQAVNRHGETDFQLHYRDGGAWVGDEVYAQAGDPGFSLSAPERPVLVLIGRGTRSSGEALSLAFRGDPYATLMGHETSGMTSSNSRIELSDGALLFVTSSLIMDPNGQVYGGTIQPDIPFEQTSNSEELGTIPLEALEWLQANAVCED